MLYLINRFILSFMELNKYIIPYLNDVLCMPIMLSLALFFQQKVVYKSAAYSLNKVQVVFTIIYVTIVFEGVLPILYERYTRDIWDILAYMAGGAFFYFFMNPKASRQPKAADKIHN